MSEVLEEIEKLAGQVVKKALSDDIPMQEKMDALKLLTPYYTALKKAKTRLDEPPDGEPTMADMRAQLHDAEEPVDGGIEASGRRTGNGT